MAASSAPVIVIPAAGASARMRGRDKLLEIVDAESLLRRVARRALATGLDVAVTLPADDPARRQALDGLALTCLPVKDAAKGMAGSLRQGAALAKETGARGMMVLPADMPDLTTDDLCQVLAAFDGANASLIVRGATATVAPGHPVLFPAAFYDAIAKLRGDQGARAVLRNRQVVLVPLPGQHALTDLDTPQDWAQWRAKPTDAD